MQEEQMFKHLAAEVTFFSICRGWFNELKYLDLF